MPTPPRSQWFIQVEAVLPAAGREEAASAWVNSLLRGGWRGAPAAAGREPLSGLHFRWGGDGEERIERWAFVDLVHERGTADGTIAFNDVASARATMRLTLGGASPNLARATFRTLCAASPGEATGFLAEVSVGTSASGGLGQGGPTEVGWLSLVRGALPPGGPYVFSERVDAGTLVEAYAEGEADKGARLRGLDAWLRSLGEPAATPPQEVASAPAPPELASPSYLLSPDPFAGDAGDLTAPPLATEPLDLGHLRSALDRGAMPFAGTTSPERLAELRSAAAAEDPTMFPAPAAGDGDSTMMLSTSALRAELAGPAFAAGLAATPFPDLSVDRYAALTAELEAKGPTPDLLRRYDIPTEASLRVLKEEMARRFEKDPALGARFHERVTHFLGFLRGKGGER
jgi:hypothetical protein